MNNIIILICTLPNTFNIWTDLECSGNVCGISTNNVNRLSDHNQKKQKNKNKNPHTFGHTDRANRNN